MRYLQSVLCTLLVLFTASAEAAKFKKAPGHGIPVPNEYIVVIAEGVARNPNKPQQNLPAAAQIAQLLGNLHGGEVTEVWEHALRGFVIRTTEAKAKKLANDPRVLSVEQNFGLSSPIEGCYPPAGAGWQDTRTLPSPTSSTQSLTCSDPDPSHDSGGSGVAPACKDNWGLDRVDQTGWARDEEFSFVNNGNNVHVYLLDTGVQWSHREFKNAAGNTRVSGGADARNEPWVAGTSTNTDDCYGHGTHVAAIIAGRTYGVAKDALLHPVRTRDCSDAGQSALFIDRTVRALDFIASDVADKRSQPLTFGAWPSVVNWSGGNDPSHAASTALQTEVATLLSINVPIVQAAGNSTGYYDPTKPWLRINLDVCSRTFGGQFPDVIVAGGVDYNDERLATSTTFGSNAGSCVDIWAPALDIISADMDGDDVACRLSGTSMAAPHVTGAVAAYLQSNNTATPTEIERALRSRGTWNPLQSSASNSRYIGDSDNVLLFSDTRSMGADTAPVAAFTVTCPGRQCNLNASGSTDDVGIDSYEWRITDPASSTDTVVAYGITTLFGAQAQFTFSEETTGHIVLKVTDITGKTDHLYKTVVVASTNAPPTASFTATCTGTSCSFNSTASSDDSAIVSRNWTFGDGNTGTGTSPNHTYATGNVYTVTLTVADAAGQTDTETQTVNVNLQNPTNVVATGSGVNVTIAWTGAANATGYTVERKSSSGAWQVAGTTSSTSMVDNAPASSNGVVLYRVFANFGSAVSAASNTDVAFVGTFSNDPPVVLTTGVKAEHITEVRAAVNGLLSIGGQTTVYSGSDLDPNNLRLQPVDEGHFVTLLQNLNTARVASGLPTLTFGSPAFDTPIFASHLNNLRSGLK